MLLLILDQQGHQEFGTRISVDFGWILLF